MIKRWITIAASAAMLAPLGVPPAMAYGRDGPDEPEIREIRDRDIRDRDVRDRDVREREDRDRDRDVRDREDRDRDVRDREIREREDRAKEVREQQERQQERELKALEKDARETEKQAEREAKEVEKEAREAEKEAEKEAKEAEKEAEEAEKDSGNAAPEEAAAWQADALLEEGADRDEAGNPVRQGEVIAFALPAEAERQLSASGYRVIRRTSLASLGEVVVRLAVPRGRNLAAALREVRALAPDAVTDYEHYYGLGLASRGKPKRSKATLAPATRSQRFSVGMIDTAVAAHPVLGSARIVAWQPGEDPKAGAGHGTAVASLMAVQGADTIYSANIFRGPAARPFTSIDILAEALEWQIAQGASVINLSIAGPANALLEKMVAIAAARGRIVVASAGNGGPAAAPAFPAAFPGVVAVTAVDPAMRVYRYANRGRYIAVAAQGVGVQAARAEGGFARFTGTSFASPLVAARLARCRASGTSASACKDQMMKSARDLGTPGFDEVYGNGYVE